MKREPVRFRILFKDGEWIEYSAPWEAYRRAEVIVMMEPDLDNEGDYQYDYDAGTKYLRLKRRQTHQIDTIRSFEEYWT